MLHSFILSTWIYLLFIPLTGIQISRMICILQIHTNTNDILLSFPLGRHTESNFLSLVSWPLPSFTSISFCFRIHTFSLGYDHYSPFPFGTSSPLPFLMIVPPLQNSLERFKCPTDAKGAGTRLSYQLVQVWVRGEEWEMRLKIYQQSDFNKMKRILRTDHFFFYNSL